MASRRIPLRTKLLAGFGAVLALMAILAFALISKSVAIGDRAEVIGEKVVPSIKIVDEAESDLGNLRQHQLEHVIADTAKEKRALEESMAEDREELQAGFGEYRRDLISDARDRQLLDAVAGALTAYERASEPFRAQSAAGRTARASAVLTAAGEQYDAAGDALDAWLAYNDKLAAAALGDARAATTSARTTAIVLLLAALAIGGTIAVLLSRSIRRSVAAIVDRLETLRGHCATQLGIGLQRLATGDLTYEVTPVTTHIERWSNDELGDVAQATNAIRDRLGESIDAYDASRKQLGELVTQVSSAASSVSSGSQQMAATSEETGRAVGEIAHAVTDVATGAQRQVQTIESARGTAEQVSHVTEESAQAAQDTAVAAERAREIAAEGAGAVGQATEAMAAVREASQLATSAIRDLGAKSDQIGGIVGTITGIAEQTNLLALNAAIEAARAGEQGRGFAVVADEVRKLAEESQTAAQSIATLIGEIQAETGRAIEVVENGGRRTDDGAATVEQAREAFQAIDTAVEDVTARVAQIAASVQEVAASSASMRSDMADVASVAEESSASAEQVSASTQQTSAAVQQVSATASDLAATAAELERLVGRFTVAA